MNILLWRHAEAEPGYPDMQRALTTHGINQAQKVAGWLNRHIPDNTTILVSPAIRTQQTASALGRKFTTLNSIAPDASHNALIEASNWPDNHGWVLIVGHQPTLGETISTLTTGQTSSWTVEKGALWWLTGDKQSLQIKTIINPELL